MFWVAALNALQNSMMLSPRWPNAPARPAEMDWPCPALNLQLDVTFATFFAIVSYPFFLGLRGTVPFPGLSERITSREETAR